jgi:LacI family transcriptional regulator
VLEAAKAANYVPNRAARSLRLSRSDGLGVIVADFRADWAEQFLNGMLGVLDSTRFSPFVAVHRFDEARSRKELQTSLERRDEGIVCQPLPKQEEVYRQIAAAGTPLVLLGDYPARMSGCSYVVWDSGPAAAVAVRHLIEVGRRRIAYLGVDYPMVMSRRRYAAYVSTLREAGLVPERKWEYVAPATTNLDAVMTAALRQFFGDPDSRPDAIFCLNDGLAMPLLQRLEAEGIRVPHDVAVMGMGDLPFTGYAGIGLSTVREPITEIGREAALSVLQLIEHPEQGPVQKVIPSLDLRVRRTTMLRVPDGGDVPVPPEQRWRP